MGGLGQDTGDHVSLGPCISICGDSRVGCWGPEGAQGQVIRVCGVHGRTPGSGGGAGQEPKVLGWDGVPRTGCCSPGGVWGRASAPGEGPRQDIGSGGGLGESRAE